MVQAWCIHMHNIPVLQVRVVWPYTQLIHLAPPPTVRTKSSLCVGQNDLQHPPAGIGELPMGEAHGPLKDFTPPEQPFILEISELSMGRLSAGRWIQGEIQGQEVTQWCSKQAGEGLMQHCS